MASIDERIVAMAFENAKFEAGVAQTMATLAKLNAELQKVGSVTGFADIDKAAAKVNLDAPMSALDKLKARLGMVGSGAAEGFSEIDKAGNKVTLDGPISALDKLKARLGMVGSGAADGFSEIDKAANRVDMKGVNDAIDTTAKHFGILQGAASVAFGNLSTMAAMKGGAIAKDLSLGPVMDGYKEYATNLNSIQTILANTKQSGATLTDVNKALASLNHYSDQTIYNFGQMAHAIGTFTSAGVDLDRSVVSIKGIANIAAMSGANAEEAARSFTQLSQAIASGKVGAQDWNSMVANNMASSQFKKSLVETAEAMGTLNKNSVDVKDKMGNLTIAGESFRDSIMSKPGEKPWLTSDVLVNTLAQFSGDLTDAQLKSQGFTDAQIKGIKSVAQTAKLAATDVKTLSQVWDVAKETAGSGWSATFQHLFGDFDTSKKLFTGLSNYVNGLINTSANARNKILADWEALGGRANLIQGLKNAWADFLALIKPIKDAFRDIFPPKTGKDLADLTDKFLKFTEKLRISPATADLLKRTFAGLFAVLDIGKHVVGEIIGLFGHLFGVAGKGAGGFLTITASIGDFLKSVDQALVKGGALHGVFLAIGAVLKLPIMLLSALAHAIGALFAGKSSDGAKKFGDDMSSLGERLKPLKNILEAVKAGWEKLVHFFQGVGGTISPMLSELGAKFKHFADIVADAFKNADYSKVFSAIQTVLIGGIFVTLKKALGGGKGISDLIGIDLGGLNKVLGALTGNLTALQKNIQASTLLKIAAAIGILAAGITALSLVDPKALSRAMSAVAIGLGELVGALALLAKFTKGGMMFSMPLMAGSLILLAAAVTILAGAVTIFAKLSWEDLLKGLAGVAGALVAVGAAMRLMPLNMTVTAAALLPVAVALNIMAVAVSQFSKIAWRDMVSGILGLSGALVGIGMSMQFFGPETLLVGPGLIAIAVAMSMLAGAVAAFGKMKLGTLAKGVLGIAGALVAIGLAIQTIPPTIAAQAAGLMILSLALAGIAGAIGIMGKMKLDTLAKGLATLGGMLVILSLGLTGMSGALPGAAALMATALALAVLAPVMVVLGHLSWETIIKGLVAIAGVLGTIAIVGVIAAPALAALGLALLPLAAALTLSAGAAWILGQALSVLSDTGVKGITVMIAAITAFVAILPKIAIDFVKGLLSIAEEMAKLAPQVVGALTKILDALIQVVINSAPRLAIAIGVLVDSFLQVLIENTPKLLAAGAKLMLDFLKSLADNIPKIVPEAIRVVTTFLTTLAAHIADIVKAAVNLITKFALALASQAWQIVAAGVKMVVSFMAGITAKIPDLVNAAVNLIVQFLNSIAKRVPDVIRAGANIIISFIKGIGDNSWRIVRSAIDTAGKFIVALAGKLPDLADKGFEAIINFVNGVANAIRTHSRELWQAGFNLASAILDGLAQGIGMLADKIYHLIPGPLRGAISVAKHVLGISSPSSVFMYFGQMINEGLVKGLTDTAQRPVSAAANMVQAVADTVNRLPDDLGGNLDLQPTITPILDLSAVQRDATKLKDLTNVVPISAAASYNQAATISTEKTSADTATAAQAAQAAPSFKFEQNNYSPESLSDIEIYRQTRNQLSQVKSALGLP